MVAPVTATLRAVAKHRADPASAALTGRGKGLGSTGPAHLYWTASLETEPYTLNTMPLAGGTVTTLRSVLMKPEHRDTVPEIARLLSAITA